jgi:hypothetical protein
MVLPCTFWVDDRKRCNSSVSSHDEDARRHFHTALACWTEGRLDECVQSIVLGMTYGREITQALAARRRRGQSPRADDPYWQ